MKTEKLFKLISITLMLVISNALFAQTKNIVETAMGSESHTTLVAAVKAADLVSVLTGQGPFTVFAPTNDAFAKLPAGTVETLLKPENKTTLQSILKYHVVSGKFMAADVIALINKNNGKATIATVNGENLAMWLKDGSVYLTDAKGNTSKVIMADLDNSNGVIHLVDTVLLP
jgi:uncharacterized surface protein with fasciclin (FAS1) repeats